MTSTVQREQRIQTVCLVVLSAVALGGALYWLSPVLIPFVLAVFFTYCLAPVIDLQVRYLRIPRTGALLVAAFLGCVILVSVGMVISTSVGQMSAHAGDYQAQIRQLLDRMAAAAPFERFGFRLEDLSDSVASATQGSVAGMISGTVSGVMNVLSNGMMVLIFMIFMLMGDGGSRTSVGGDILAEVQAQIKHYVLAMGLLSGATGLLVGVVLRVLGVEFAWMFGFLAFLLNFIPNIGSIVATLLPLPVVWLSPDLSPVAKVLAVVVPGLVQFVLGNLVQPRVMGGSLDLHPVVVLMSLIFFGMIWGIVGMFLATPITAVTKILLEKMRFTAPMAGLLAGRLDGFGPL